MTLQEVVQRAQAAQHMAEKYPGEALKRNRALFLDLIRQDRAFIIPEAAISSEALAQKLFRPYIAPAQEGDPRLFVRVFSHSDLATAFAERQGQDQICELTGIELVQLAKSYFLRGAYGFLLNDGTAWTAISFPDLLTDFYREILGDESLARTEFVALIQFINMVRQNYAYNIQVGRPSVQDAAMPVQVRFTDRPNDIWSPEAGEWLYEDCKLDHLRFASGYGNEAQIHIKTAKCDLRVQPAYLRAALCAAGLADRMTQPELNFHTDSITLDYRMQDFDLERFPLQCELAELPRLEEETPEPEEPVVETPAEKPKWQPPPFIAALLAKFKKPEKAAEPEPAEEVLDVPPDEQPAAKEEAPPAEKKKFELDPKKMAKWFLIAALLIIIIAVIAHLLKPSPVEKVKEAVEAGNAVQAVTLYDTCIVQEPDSRDELLQLFATDLQDSLDAYAADQITANQLADKINAYQEITALQSKCDAVYVQASALEQSKAAYNRGLVETSMVDRLTAWQGVIQADTGSMAAMQNALDSNADVYKDLLFAEIEDMDRGSALSALMLLQSYYPNDKDVVERIQAWREQMASQQSPDSGESQITDADTEDEWPILVGDLSVSYNGVGWDLYIPWQNESGSAINGLLFAVTALDANGTPVVSTIVNTDGQTVSYSRYIADAGQGPYEDGYVWPETYFWSNAWVTDQEIQSVRLDGIWMSYENAELAPWTYTADEEEAVVEEEPIEEEPSSVMSWADLIGGGA